MTDTTAAPLADPGPPPPLPDGAPRPENRFFEWIRTLGIPRGNGWVGGVCSGIAARIGIDPLIVRGIFVVAALVGFPALLIYAIAWALLPDSEGRILLQQLFRGAFEPALVAIAILAVVSLVPVVPWLWSLLFWPFAAVSAAPWSSPLSDGFASVLVIAVIALVVWLVVRSRRTPRGGTAQGAPEGATAPWVSVGVHQSADAATWAAGWDAASAPTVPLAPEPSAPAAAPEDASTDELAEWRARHDAWRVEHDAWRRQQADADAAAREQARRERDAAGSAFAAEAQARRQVRLATKPRANAVAVLSILGAALITGALTALLTAGGIGVGGAAAAGLLAAAIVCATGMVVAGLLRRRSGFLAFATIVLLCAGLLTAVSTTTDTVLRPGASLSTLSTAEQRFLQPFGDTTFVLYPWEENGESTRTGAIVLRKGSGSTTIEVWPGSALDLDASLAAGGELTFERVDVETGRQTREGTVIPDREGGGNDYRWTATSPAGDDDDPITTVPVVIDQAGGTVHVIIYEE